MEREFGVVQTEEVKLEAKIIKVSKYWKKTSLFIPNVFSLIKPYDDEPQALFEFLDLSKKEVLI